MNKGSCSTCRSFKDGICSFREGYRVEPGWSCFFHTHKDLEPIYERTESRQQWIHEVSKTLGARLGVEWLNTISGQDLIEFIDWAEMCGYNMLGYDEKLFAAFKGFCVGRSKGKNPKGKNWRET